jgi:hypothetical protein
VRQLSAVLVFGLWLAGIFYFAKRENAGAGITAEPVSSAKCPPPAARALSEDAELCRRSGGSPMCVYLEGEQ